VLSRFEAFVGWKPLSDVSPIFNVRTLRRFAPSGTMVWSNDTLTQVVRDFLLAYEQTIREIEDDLVKFIPEELEVFNQVYIVGLLPRLQGQYRATNPGTL